MEHIRKPFQGIFNIVRFNWHFYVFSAVFLIILAIFSQCVPPKFGYFLSIIGLSAFLVTLLSLIISFYVYDISGLYQLNWLEKDDHPIKIANINAGFDETSILLTAKFPNATLTVLDFYDPAKHTEISISRARKVYPPYPNTKNITTSNLSVSDNSIDKIFLILAAHEIRADEERIIFFKELNRILKQDGTIYVTEHLRDSFNFFAYNIGFFHFLSKKTWRKTFDAAQLNISKEQKITPFITNFTLKKYGITT